MRSFAILNASGIVTNVVVVDDGADGPSGELAAEYFPDNPAHIGGDYVEGYFYAPRPYPSWTRDSGSWLPPTPHPAGGGEYRWDEDTLSWVEIEPLT